MFYNIAMKDLKKETLRIDQDLEAFDEIAGDFEEQGMEAGSSSGFEGAGTEKLIDAGFFNAFEDDFDEDDIAL